MLLYDCIDVVTALEMYYAVYNMCFVYLALQWKLSNIWSNYSILIKYIWMHLWVCWGGGWEMAGRAAGSKPWGIHISETTGRIFSVQSSNELSRHCAMLRSFANLPHTSLPMGQKLVKFGSRLWEISYLWNCWYKSVHSKFYGIVHTRSCATWLAHLPYMGLSMGTKLIISGTTGIQTSGNHISETAGWIYSILRSMEWSILVVVLRHNHLPHISLPMTQKPEETAYMRPGVRLNITWESPYLGKTVFILRRGPVITMIKHSIYSVYLPIMIPWRHKKTKTWWGACHKAANLGIHQISMGRYQAPPFTICNAEQLYKKTATLDQEILYNHTMF